MRSATPDQGSPCGEDVEGKKEPCPTKRVDSLVEQVYAGLAQAMVAMQNLEDYARTLAFLEEARIRQRLVAKEQSHE